MAEARLLADAIYQLTRNGSFSKDYEPINQINRASGSVMDTIAEGFGRGSRAEFKQFLGFSLGSISEVKSKLYRAADRGHITPDQFKELYNAADSVTKMIVGFMKYLGTTTYSGTKFMEEMVDYQNYKP